MTENPTPGPEPNVSDEEFISLFEKTSDPVLSTAEVTEQVSLSRRAVYDRLVSLEKDDLLEKKDIGGRNTVWWLSDN